MKKTDSSPVFHTDRRIRLGIWGLGRGMSFYSTCRFLNIDVVAGCDYNEHMRKRFADQNPGAFVSADADEFLRQDFDAVLLATYCPAHAPDAIKCLAAGKHVVSEVTAFHTMAEGVRLVDEVEKRGLVYNLAENYPFSAANMYLARKWKEGLFGDLMYAEYEYVHECRPLAYTYIDGVPVQPGWTVHNWRSWINFHYYCTHSLGPVMVITGTRPTRVVALPGRQRLAGYLIDSPEGMGGVTPSLINMTGGGIVRNLMGATTNDSHVQRIWGTLGAAEIGVGKHLQLRLGGAGHSPKMEVNPTWDGLGELAAKTGHGGGDFWVLYYFARQILTGQPGPFDVYGAADVTIPGILAYRSSLEEGKPFEVPDFRRKEDRDRYRDDDWAQPRYDVKRGVFMPGADTAVTQGFSKTITDLIRHATTCRAYVDWKGVAADLAAPESLLGMAEGIAAAYPQIRETYTAARKLAKAYPDSDGARVLREMLDVGCEAKVLATGFLAGVKREIMSLRRLYPATSFELTAGVASPLLPKAGDIRRVNPPRTKLTFSAIPYHAQYKNLDIRPVHGNKQDGLVFIRGTITVPRSGKGVLLYGADGPVKVWVNGRAVGCEPRATNPARIDEYRARVAWKKGRNAILVAMHTNRGQAWGFIGRASLQAAT